MRILMEKFNRQFDFIQQAVAENDQIVITTLGPEGTSSEQAAKYLIDQFKQINSDCIFRINLINNFIDIFYYLENTKEGYVLIPNAYENINDFYWNPNFANVLNFLFATPKYGLIKKVNNSCLEKRKLKIASCPAVQGIYKYLMEELLQKKKIEILKTNSTVETIKYIIEEKADIGITNESAFASHAYANEIEFISKKYNATIVWSLFEYNTGRGRSYVH